MPLAFLADHDQAADAWDRCIDINLKGVLHGTYAVYDHMVRQGSGHIVNMASIYGNYGVAGSAVYGATKAAVITFRSEEHTSELQSLMRISYAAFCLKKKLHTRLYRPNTPFHAQQIRNTVRVSTSLSFTLV